MKKIMTALLCALGFSLASQAEGSISGTNFEGLTAGTGVMGISDDGLTTDTYWDGDKSKVEAVVTNMPPAQEEYSGEYPSIHGGAGNTNNCLYINTRGEGLVRKVNLNGDAEDVGTGIYFDSMVQFTSTNELDPATTNESDKLVIWLCENDNGTTNLVVTAGYLDDTYNVSPTNYVVSADVEADKWYRLTIKAMKNVISYDEREFAGYAIYINGVLAQYEGSAFDDQDYQVNSACGDYYNNDVHALFPSLINWTDTENKDKITSVAFNGVGRVDDIEFTTERPIFKIAARIGEVGYETFADALGAAVAGDTITLLESVALTSTVTIDKNLTIDLNGYNVAATDCRAFHVTAGAFALTGTGNVSATATAGSAFKSSSSVIRVGSDTDVTSFTLGENVTVSSDYCYGVSYFGTKKQTVVINGTVAVTGEQAAISGNGLAKYNTAAGGSDVTVNGTVTATQDYAIYNPQTGTTVINGTVTGLGGIEVKAGSVTVNNGAVITATAQSQSHTTRNDGTSTSGYAIASVGNANYPGEPAVTIAGGTISGLVVVLADQEGTENGTITATSNQIAKPQGYKWVETETSGVYTLKEIVYATVTITQVANCTITVKNGNAVVETGAQFDTDDSVQLTVTRVAAEGYKLKDCAAEETVSVIGNVTITAVVEEDASNLDPEKGSTSVPVKAESENAAVAVAKSGITVPAGATVEKAAYAEYFNYSVSGENGEYTVTINGIKETVEASVAESAVERLTNDEATAIEVPAGLYYKITPSTGLPIDGEPQSGLSTGGSVTIGKPGTGTGFYKIELSPTAFPAQNN